MNIRVTLLNKVLTYQKQDYMFFKMYHNKVEYITELQVSFIHKKKHKNGIYHINTVKKCLIVVLKCIY